MEDSEIDDVEKSNANSLNFSANDFERYCMYDKYCREQEKQQEKKDDEVNEPDQVEL